MSNEDATSLLGPTSLLLVLQAVAIVVRGVERGVGATKFRPSLFLSLWDVFAMDDILIRHAVFDLSFKSIPPVSFASISVFDYGVSNLRGQHHMWRRQINGNDWNFVGCMRRGRRSSGGSSSTRGCRRRQGSGSCSGGGGGGTFFENVLNDKFWQHLSWS